MSPGGWLGTCGPVPGGLDATLFLRLGDGERKTRDDQGADLPDLAREELPDGDRRVFLCKVRDENGTVMFIATLSLVVEWLDGSRQSTPQ